MNDIKVSHETVNIFEEISAIDAITTVNNSIISELLTDDLIEIIPMPSKKRTRVRYEKSSEDDFSPTRTLKKDDCVAPCKFNGCTEKLCYGFKAYPTFIFSCKKHSLPGTIKIKPGSTALCVADYCDNIKKKPSGQFCHIHDHKAQVTSLNQCKALNCGNFVLYHRKSKLRKKFCPKHKPDNKYKKCVTTNCIMSAKYANKIDYIKTHCIECKLPGMIDINVGLCEVVNCSKQINCNNGTDKKQMFCREHSKL